MISSIITDYISFLNTHHFPYNATGGLSVRFEFQSGNYTYVDVNVHGKTTVYLTDYFGTCYTGYLSADKLCEELKRRFPAYRIWMDKDVGYEIRIEKRYTFSSVYSLHKQICMIAEAVDTGARLGKEMLGTRFET